MVDEQVTAQRIEIGKRLREARRRRGLSQSDIARSAGITQASVSNYETGKRELPLSTVLNLVAALDVPLGELMDVPAVIVIRDSNLGVAVRAINDSPELMDMVVNGHAPRTF